MTQPTESFTAAAPRPVLTNTPPPVPRDLNRLSLHRAWTEPRVRIWWFLALGILVLVSIYAAGHLWEWHSENNLIQHGTLVSAKVIEGISASDQHLTSEHQNVEPDAVVTLAFDWHGKPMQVRGQLDSRTDRIPIASMIPIHVLAKDPSVWTYRSEPIPLLNAVLMELVLLPIVPVMMLVAMLKRKRLLATWATGDAVVGIVADCRQTPIAPLSYAVRCSLRDSRDRRLFMVYVPRSGTDLKKGDALWIITARGGTAQAVAGLWMQQA